MDSLKKYLSELPFAVTEEDEQRMNRERSLTVVKDWTMGLGNRLPKWPHARWTNDDWRKRLDQRMAEGVRRWAPVKRDGTRYVADQSIVTLGESGYGKSTALMAQLALMVSTFRKRAEAGEIISRLPSILWVTEAELVQEQRGYDSERLEWASEVDICILDELGASNGHQAMTGAAPVVHALVTKRYDRGKRTCATSGMKRHELSNRYGAAVARRLLEASIVVEAWKV